MILPVASAVERELFVRSERMPLTRETPMSRCVTARILGIFLRMPMERRRELAEGVGSAVARVMERRAWRAMVERTLVTVSRAVVPVTAIMMARRERTHFTVGFSIRCCTRRERGITYRCKMQG